MAQILAGILLVAACLFLLVAPFLSTIRTRSFVRGKVVLITGGSRGLGLALARKICAGGGCVAIIARDPEELARAKGDLDSSAEVLTVKCDLLDFAQIRSAVKQTLNRFGRIDILINNAGTIEIGPLDHMNREDFERAMQLHFWAPYELVTQLVPEMRRRGGGRIVNISSIGGRVTVPHMAPYSSSKFALTGFSDAIRAELARDKIFVTTVTPGMMRTESQIHAKFKGDHCREYKWFELSSRLPLASISAERAARKILAACRRGSSVLVMPGTAYFIMAANAVFPNLVGCLMKTVNRCLPIRVNREGDEMRTGADVRHDR